MIEFSLIIFLMLMAIFRHLSNEANHDLINCTMMKSTVGEMASSLETSLILYEFFFSLLALMVGGRIFHSKRGSCRADFFLKFSIFKELKNFR